MKKEGLRVKNWPFNKYYNNKTVVYRGPTLFAFLHPLCFLTLCFLELQKILGHVSVLTTTRYTHLTNTTKNNACQAINTLANSFDIRWGGVK